MRPARWVTGTLVIGFSCWCTATQAAEGAPPNWDDLGARAARLLAEYVRIDTQNPPGRTVEAADYLEGHLRSAGLPVERFSAEPEKPFEVARLRGRGHLAKPIVL